MFSNSSFESRNTMKELSRSSSSILELDLSFSEDESLDDARMMRSMQLATINLTPQELVHHSLWSANIEINETLPVDSVRTIHFSRGGGKGGAM